MTVQVQDGPCCWLELCCPPEKAAAALADLIAADFGWSTHKNEEGTGNARAIADWVLNRFQLVPRTVQPRTESGDSIPVYPENRRLVALHEHVTAELRQVLIESGQPVTSEDEDEDDEKEE